MAAESVGLAASVGGLVSLGLQIAGGILKYVDAFESRQDDLEFVRTNSEALKATLRVIETWANSPGQGPEAIAAATRSMQLFEMELCNVKALHDELADLDGPDWTSRLANKKKKLTYAFSRPKIQGLGQRLQKATNALQLTLNGLGLGKAYPTAVTIYNESLMHRAVDNFYVAQMNRPYYDAESNLANILIELIQMLLSYGVAAFTYDTLG
ncbi:hypothetical protein CkaCkLH20_01664 [Colletotrichum karsti]|uniref:Fungal N-terminal domain-containing protein n=1 Tax=Colletotrichum karsti TaxID=1095194 RepID=A0A9P6LQE3_9PEZI|nr:uncharacterized protein CkaCkLH20_01664 [Colletotrichum karsti]KAF9880622.1 hypothetical protein CkaCkLH20_01664 [Colletotrichum karsti]